MEPQNDEINIKDLWRVIVNRKFLIISFPIGFGILALIISLSLPKLYNGEAIVAISNSPNYSIMNNLEIENFIKVLVKAIKNGSNVALLDNSSAQKIIDIKAELINNADSEIKIVVQVADDPQIALTVLNRLIDYFQTNEYMQKKLNVTKIKLQTKRDEKKKLLEKAIKIRDETLRSITSRSSLGFNPIDMEIQISNLRTEITELDSDFTFMKGFEFVIKPFVYKESVKAISTNVSAGIIFGFFAAFLIAIMMESYKKK